MATVAAAAISRINKKISMHQLDYVGSHDAARPQGESARGCADSRVAHRADRCIVVGGGVDRQRAILSSAGNLVKHDDARALLGVLSGERDVSKGIITTTSDFASRIVSDPFIKPFMPTRLELLNGERLQKWLASLV